MSDELKTYHLGNISIDSEGRFHIHFAGLRKGSPTVVPLHAYGKNLHAILKPIAENMQKCVPLYTMMIEHLPKEADDAGTLDS